MLRISGFLTVVLVIVAGCSKHSATLDNSKKSPSDRPATARSDGQQTVSGDPATEPHVEPGEPAVASGKGEAGEGTAKAKPKPESPVVPNDPETHAAVFKWLEQMGSGAAIERRAASEALDKLGEAGMPFVVLGLRKGSKLQKRGAATYLIGRVSPRDVDTVPALIETLSAEDEALRRASLQAVEKLPAEQLVEALPVLVAFARNRAEAAAYRSRAIRAITKLGPRGESAATELIQLARDDESMNVRRACFFAIVKVAPARVAEEFYQRQLKDNETADLRRLAAKWLAGVASSDQSLDCLVDALRDRDKSVRLEAVNALVAIGKPALRALIKALESPDVETRRHATLAVGKLGLLAADAAPALKARLDDPDKQVRELAKAALKVL